MNRTTIMLPEGLKAQAAREARKRGVSLGQLIRESLEGWLMRTVADDPLLADNAVFEDDGPEDMAAEHDRYLYGDERDLR